MSSNLPVGQQSKGSSTGLSVEVGERVCDRSGETCPDDTRRYVRLLFNGEGISWLGPQPQEVADALVAALGGLPAGPDGRQSNPDLWQLLVDRFHARDCACKAPDLHTEDVWEYYGNFADIAAEIVVARVRAQALRDFAEVMRASAEEAPADEPAKWPWSAYALAAVKAEEHAGKAFPSSPAALPDVVGTPELDGACHSVWLHGKWRWLTQQMTTPEKEAFADAVDRAGDALADGELRLPVDRWWREPVRVDRLPEE